jgi:hypothetical protein
METLNEILLNSYSTPLDVNPYILALLAFLLCGLINRWRGGWTPIGLLNFNKQVRRGVLVWSFIFVAGMCVPLNFGYALLMAALGFVGLVVGWGSYMDLGTSPNKDNERLKPILDFLLGDDSDSGGSNGEWHKTIVHDTAFRRDFLGLTLRGILFTLLMFLPMAFVGVPYVAYFGLLLVGAVMAPTYYLATLPVGRISKQVPHFNWGPELGEFLFAGSMSALIVLLLT